MATEITSIELYFDQLIHAKELSQVFVTDTQGKLILVRSGVSAAGDDEAAGAMMDADSNIVISGARAMTSFEGLRLGVPQFVSIQFHDAMAVQFVDGACLITLVGARSQDQCIGGLIALAQQMRSGVAVFRDMVKAITDASKT